jgi:hypothetical protein
MNKNETSAPRLTYVAYNKLGKSRRAVVESHLIGQDLANYLQIELGWDIRVMGDASPEHIANPRIPTITVG